MNGHNIVSRQEWWMHCETNIHIELSAQGERTFLLMTHFGLPTEDERTSHQGGWTGALTNLERLFEPRSTP
jgi:uncharacterized protein YndB with AHSA1/START domain